MANWVIPLHQVVASKSLNTRNMIMLGAMIQLANLPLKGPRTTLVGPQSPISAALSRFIPAIKAGRAVVYLDRYWDPCGYVTWGEVDNLTESKLLEGTVKADDPNLWHSGDNIWIYDLYVRRGNLSAILEELGATVLHRCTKLTFERVRGPHMLFTILSREKPSLLLNALDGHGLPWLRRRLALTDWCGDPPELPRELSDRSVAPRVATNLASWHALGVAYAGLVNQNLTSVRRLFSELLWPLALSQYSLTEVPTGENELLVTWGWLSDRTLSDDPNRIFHPGEWNEGPHPCIKGIFWNQSKLTSHLEQALNNAFPTVDGLYVITTQPKGMEYVYLPRGRWGEFATEVCRH